LQWCVTLSEEIGANKYVAPTAEKHTFFFEKSDRSRAHNNLHFIDIPLYQCEKIYEGGKDMFWLK